MEQTKRTYKDLAQEAYSVQDACNISGVAYGLARAVADLRALGRPVDSLYGNDADPVIVLWVDKLCHLVGMQLNNERDRRLDDAYKEIVKVKQGDQTNG